VSGRRPAGGPGAPGRRARPAASGTRARRGCWGGRRARAQAGAITGFLAAFTEGPIDFYKSQIQYQIIRAKSDPSYKRAARSRTQRDPTLRVMHSCPSVHVQQCRRPTSGMVSPDTSCALGSP